MPSQIEVAVRQAAWRLRKGESESDVRAWLAVAFAAAGAAFADRVLTWANASVGASNAFGVVPGNTPLRDLFPLGEPVGDPNVTVRRTWIDPDGKEKTRSTKIDVDWGTTIREIKDRVDEFVEEWTPVVVPSKPGVTVVTEYTIVNWR